MSRVGTNNKIVASFANTNFGLSTASGTSGFNAGVNGFNAWLSPASVARPFTAASDSRAYVAGQSSSPSAPMRGTANSGLTFTSVTSPTLVGPRRTTTGPQLVLVFNPRSL
jgi:hypothetical protein